MKGYVSVTFADKQKQELFDLYDKINEFNKKPNSEVFGYTTFTTEHKFLWWKWTKDVKMSVFDCPDRIQPFFASDIWDDEHFYFELNKFGNEVANIYHLVKQSETVLLGEELLRTLNLLQKHTYISI